jgi:hypothetical protein
MSFLLSIPHTKTPHFFADLLFNSNHFLQNNKQYVKIIDSKQEQGEYSCGHSLLQLWSVLLRV